MSIGEQFYIHNIYRFDGPVMVVRDDVAWFFNAEHKSFDDNYGDSERNYVLKNLEPTRVELLLRLMPESYYKDQFKVYLKSCFYEDILED